MRWSHDPASSGPRAYDYEDRCAIAGCPHRAARPSTFCDEHFLEAELAVLLDLTDDGGAAALSPTTGRTDIRLWKTIAVSIAIAFVAGASSLILLRVSGTPAETHHNYDVAVEDCLENYRYAAVVQAGNAELARDILEGCEAIHPPLP